MLRDIAHYLVFGKPLVMYGGILTLFSFLTTAYIGTRVLKPQNGIPFKYHLLMTRVAIAIALIHATLGLSLYF